MTAHKILIGDARETLNAIQPESVHMAVTSPPYYGLRRYFGGELEIGQEQSMDCIAWATGADECGECYVCHIGQVMDEVWRVLRKDGTLWLNIGDSYSSAGGAHGGRADNQNGVGVRKAHGRGAGDNGVRRPPGQLKPKDQCLVPHRVALSLQAKGWYLRSTIIWHKVNALPESVTDRPTTSHEYLFLLAKSERYFFDAFAIREKATENRIGKKFCKYQTDDYPGGSPHTGLTRTSYAADGRNTRSVWAIPFQPFDADKVGVRDVDHFAMFPSDLARRCILAGTSEAGCCEKCGAPRVRTISRKRIERNELPKDAPSSEGQVYSDVKSEAFSSSCRCEAGALPCIVLDPFGGSGTTAMVAKRYGRDSIICELNPDFARIAAARTDQEHATLDLFS